MHTLRNGCDLYVPAGGLYQVMIDFWNGKISPIDSYTEAEQF